MTSEPEPENWGKPLRPERHHYWPESVSSFWKDTEGRVIRLAWDQTELWFPPKNFGVLKDGHRLKFTPPWDSSIEHLFNDADSNFPVLIEWLQGIVPRSFPYEVLLADRIRVENCPHEQLEIMGECLASLIVRSPAFRSRLHDETVAIRKLVRPGGMPFRDEQDAKNLIVHNMSSQFPGVVELLQNSSKFLVFVSPDSEFVFGDGFLNDLDGLSPVSGSRCFVPLTPHVAVAAYRFRSSQAINRLFSMEISPSETQYLNEITQIYTKDYIYFRLKKPLIVREFLQREFLEVANSRASFLEDVGEVLRWKCR